MPRPTSTTATTSRTRPQDRYVVRAAARVLDILLAFTGTQEGFTLNELAAAVGLEKATTHRLVRTLETRGFVRRMPNGRYGLGLAAVGLATHSAADSDLLLAIQPVLRDLADRTGETAFCSVLDDASALTVGSAGGRQRLRVVIPIGERQSLLHSAPGIMLLAGLTPDSCSVLMDTLGELDRGRRSRVLEQVKAAALDQVVWDLAQHDPDVKCVSVPLHGELPAVVSICGPAGRLTSSHLAGLLALLREAVPPSV